MTAPTQSPTATSEVKPNTKPSPSLVLREVREGIATLTLNNPARRNALSGQMLKALRVEIEAVAQDETVRAVILAAEGPVFSSGHDLREVVNQPQDVLNELFTLCEYTMEALRLLPKPVIARVHALASAAGCQLVASCDLVVASTNAAFQTPGMQIGLFCSTPMVPLSRVVPPKKALEMLFTSRAVLADEAERMGLVNRIVPAGDLMSEARAYALELAGKCAPSAMRTIKAQVWRDLMTDLVSSYDHAGELMVETFAGEDFKEGLASWQESRSPSFPPLSGEQALIGFDKLC